MSGPVIAEPPTAARAGAVSRFAAFLADAVIVSLALRTTAWLLRAAEKSLGHFAPRINPGAVIAAIVPLTVAVYAVTFWTAFGQTPGKWLLGLKVVPVEGGRLRLGRAILRLVGYVISALPFYLGFLWILSPRRRGWHDRLAHTDVVYVRRAPHPKVAATSVLRARIDAIEAPSRRAYLAPPPARAKVGFRP